MCKLQYFEQREMRRGLSAENVLIESKTFLPDECFPCSALSFGQALTIKPKFTRMFTNIFYLTSNFQG